MHIFALKPTKALLLQEKNQLTFFDDSFGLSTRPLNLWIVIGDVYSGYMINIFAGIISICIRCRKLRLMSGKWSRAIMVMFRR